MREGGKPLPLAFQYLIFMAFSHLYNKTGECSNYHMYVAWTIESLSEGAFFRNKMHNVVWFFSRVRPRFFDQVGHSIMIYLVGIPLKFIG